MTRTDSEPAVHLQVYVRSLRQSLATGADVIDRVRELAGDSRASCDVFVWGDSAPPSPAAARTTAGRFVLGRVAAFRTWADRNGVSLGPGFEFRAVESGITGERFEELVLPRVSLAVYRGTDLVCVTPHDTGDGVLSVSACLDRLATPPSTDLPSAVAATLGRNYEPLARARERPPSRAGPRPTPPGEVQEAERTVSTADPAPADREQAVGERISTHASGQEAGDSDPSGGSDPSVDSDPATEISDSPRSPDPEGSGEDAEDSDVVRH